MFSAEIVVKQKGRTLARQAVESESFEGFEGAVRDAAGQAVYEAGVALGREERQAAPQNPDTR